MAGYVSLQDVTKTYQMGEVTIKGQLDGVPITPMRIPKRLRCAMKLLCNTKMRLMISGSSP